MRDCLWLFMEWWFRMWTCTASDRHANSARSHMAPTTEASAWQARLGGVRRQDAEWVPAAQGVLDLLGNSSRAGVCLVYFSLLSTAWTTAKL